MRKKRNPKTLIWTKIHHKNPQKTYFYSAKMAPKKVDKLITFEVAKLITLERPKGRQANNSPTYIYIITIGEGLIEHLLFGLLKTTLATKNEPKRGNSSNSWCVPLFVLSFQHFRQKLSKIWHSRNASSPPFLGKQTSKGRCSMRPSP